MSNTNTVQNNQLFTINKGWLQGKVKYINSINFNNRPEDVDIDLLVIHCASLPEGHYDNNNLEQLFSGSIKKNKLLELGLDQELKVSTHLYIKRCGEIIQFVPFHQRAWHAGVSNFDGRTACNDFSIGIELQGTVTSEFTKEQYCVLIKATQSIIDCYRNINKNRIVGHSDIAPVRKADPGDRFDWRYYLNSLV